jgi:hypothetical protein
MKTFKEVLSEGTKYYRGHSKGADPMRANKKGIIWVTPSEELAATYGEEVSEVSFNPRRHKIANLGEINKVGTVKDILDSIKPKGEEAQKFYDDAMYNFGGGKQRMSLPKFLHKIGSEIVIGYFRASGITVLKAKEDGVLTFGILK